MNAPTLIVGLGGAGCKVVNRVSKLVSEEQRKNTAFVVLDTDINELREIIWANPSIRAIQTSDKMQIGEYLRENEYARDNWFPVNNILNSKVATEGAGQVRAVSRLILDRAIAQGKMEPLLDAIKDLYTLSATENEQALRVIIVSSLAGGTGSGLLLPMAMFIKKHLDTHYIQNAAIIRGFFLLPEIFDLVIPQVEKKINMRSNAYAALREIDAFLMAGDNALEKKYEDRFKMSISKPGVPGEQEDYNVRPYDFCFLFDAQNANGRSLNSHDQYLDHAANCIYAQAIGPMNKRSNSSEDNTIRSTVAEHGRNRYAGAGSARLVYPTKDIQEFVALHWAKDCISEQWLSFDREYRRRVEENKKNHEAGESDNDINVRDEYIRIVEDTDSPFAEQIKKTYIRFDNKNPGEVKGYYWDDYVTALYAKVKEDEEKRFKGDKARKNANESLNNIKSDNPDQWNKFATAYQHLTQYYSNSKIAVGEMAKYVGKAMFRYTVINPVKISEQYRIEYQLKAGSEEFKHPNAVRYFLYKAQVAMTNKRLEVDNALKTKIEYLENFEKDEIDDPSTTEKENAAGLSTRKVSIADKIKKCLNTEQTRLKVAMKNYLDTVDEYRYLTMFRSVLDEGLLYLSEISKSFSNFYASFETMVTGIDARIESISNKYNNTDGDTVRYVCASSKCMEALAHDTAYDGGSMSPDSELCAGIYNSIREYSVMQKKPDGADYFSSIFEKDILGFFVKSIMERYGSLVDLDIIDALRKEAYFTCNDKSEDNIEKRMSEIIRSSRTLAAPFIEMPRSQRFDVLDACTYNAKMVESADKEGGFKKNFISKYLKDRGGKEDEEIKKNEIVFYQAFYGLRANSLSKFAPPEETLTLKRDGGEYYKAYFDVVKNISPRSTESNVVSPHLDRWWHLVSIMPDLDEGNQLAQEKKTYASLFWGLICGWFRYVPYKDAGLYKYSKEALKMTTGDGTLIVSNGTPCDHLYEVLDALCIYPELVEKIMLTVESKIKKDSDSNMDLEDGLLLGNIRKFKLPEYPLGGICEDEDACPADNAKFNRVRSIFDIPVLMRHSVTPNMLEYFDKTALDILKEIFSEMKRYLSRMCSADEARDVMCKTIVEQFELFIDDLECDKKCLNIKNVFNSTLFADMCDVVVAELEEAGDRKNLKRIKAIIDSYN